MSRKSKKHATAGERDAAVRRVLGGEESTKVARSLGVHATTLDRWVRARRAAIQAEDAPLFPCSGARVTLPETPRLFLQAIHDAGPTGALSQELGERYFGGHKGHHSLALEKIVRLAWNYGLRSQDLYTMTQEGREVRFHAGPHLGALLRAINMSQEQAERALLAHLRAKYPDA